MRALPVSPPELPHSAPLALERAAVLCTSGCDWYHGMWQYLRVLDMASTPHDSAAFYVRELAALSSGARVLVSATADYAPLELLRGACARWPQVTVLDRCATPLWLCDWYARRHGLGLTTVAGDVLTWRPEEAFDVVFSHGLLARFTATEQAAVARAWRECLRPDGRLLLVSRLDPDQHAQGAPFAAPEDFLAAVLGAMHARGLDADRLAPLAARYAQRFTRHAPQSLPVLETLLTGAGFDIVSSTTRARRTTPGLDGPGAQQRHYAEIVARPGS